MGNSSSQGALEMDAEVSKAMHPAKFVASARYHLPPRHLGDDYNVSQEVLGQGGSSTIFLGRDKHTGQKVAIKTLTLSAAERADVKREAEVYLSMDHPRIARLMDVYEVGFKVHLVMECMEGGELFDRVISMGTYSEKDAADAMWQMLLALNYIHSHGVVHRDIKLENWMYQKKGSDQLKLIDFGFAKGLEPNQKLKVSCGTLAYCAPEVLNQSYTTQCDLWSAGVILYILLCGRMPFGATSSTSQWTLIKSGIYDMEAVCWERVSNPAKDLVQKLLVVDPNRRLTAEGALHHPWIAQRDEMQASQHAVDQHVVDSLCAFARSSKFRRACMHLMAWSLSYEDRLSVRDAFLELDKQREGTIRLWEMRKVLEGKFSVPADEVARIFDALDTSHDQEVHYSDFLAAMACSQIELRDDLLHSTFNRFDTQGNGCITSFDLHQVFGDTFEGTLVEELLTEVTKDQDGKISYNQFQNYLQGHPMEN